MRHIKEMSTHNSYNLFMTSFSMPSMALSNSASDAFLQTSHSRIRTEINYGQDEPRSRIHAQTARTHIQEVIDDLDLVIHRKRPLRKVAQEPGAHSQTAAGHTEAH